MKVFSAVSIPKKENKNEGEIKMDVESLEKKIDEKIENATERKNELYKQASAIDDEINYLYAAKKFFEEIIEKIK